MKAAEELLNEVRSRYEQVYKQVVNMEGASKEANSIHNLIKYIAKNPFEDLRNQLVSKIDKEIYKSTTEINKEYIDKFYSMAKPGIEKYWGFTTEFLNSLDSSIILEKFYKCKVLIGEEKNRGHSKEHEEFQVELVKSFIYYINREFEDKMDAKCRKVYYEIMAM